MKHITKKNIKNKKKHYKKTNKNKKKHYKKTNKNIKKHYKKTNKNIKNKNNNKIGGFLSVFDIVDPTIGKKGFPINDIIVTTYERACYGKEKFICNVSSHVFKHLDTFTDIPEIIDAYNYINIQNDKVILLFRMIVKDIIITRMNLRYTDCLTSREHTYRDGNKSWIITKNGVCLVYNSHRNPGYNQKFTKLHGVTYSIQLLSLYVYDNRTYTSIDPNPINPVKSGKGPQDKEVLIDKLINFYEHKDNSRIAQTNCISSSLPSSLTSSLPSLDVSPLTASSSSTSLDTDKTKSSTVLKGKKGKKGKSVTPTKKENDTLKKEMEEMEFLEKAIQENQEFQEKTEYSVDQEIAKIVKQKSEIKKQLLHHLKTRNHYGEILDKRPEMLTVMTEYLANDFDELNSGGIITSIKKYNIYLRGFVDGCNVNNFRPPAPSDNDYMLGYERGVNCYKEKLMNIIINLPVLNILIEVFKETTIEDKIRLILMQSFEILSENLDLLYESQRYLKNFIMGLISSNAFLLKHFTQKTFDQAYFRLTEQNPEFDRNPLYVAGMRIGHRVNVEQAQVVISKIENDYQIRLPEELLKLINLDIDSEPPTIEGGVPFDNDFEYKILGIINGYQPEESKLPVTDEILSNNGYNYGLSYCSLTLSIMKCQKISLETARNNLHTALTSGVTFEVFFQNLQKTCAPEFTQQFDNFKKLRESDQIEPFETTDKIDEDLLNDFSPDTQSQNYDPTLQPIIDRYADDLVAEDAYKEKP
jgi:hypothetical protein